MNGDTVTIRSLSDGNRVFLSRDGLVAWMLKEELVCKELDGLADQVTAETFIRGLRIKLEGMK